MAISPTTSASELQQELERLKKLYHRHCLFSNNPPVSNLKFEFQENGNLQTSATFKDTHQGYDERVHGGLIAAIIDASMTQCLMGHSIIAYTVELSVRYLEPITLHKVTTFETVITSENKGQIFTLKCLVKQDSQTKAKGIAKFFGIFAELINR
ncbi:MAG: PaaI family thioesterase [Gracilimonas sp.]